VIADNRATIDRFKTARNEGTLAGSEPYKEATAALPGDALATLYMNGTVLTRAIDKRAKTGVGPVPGLGRIGWLSGAVTAKEHGFGLDLRLKGDEIEAKPFPAELPGQVPAGVSFFVDFKGLDAFLDELRRNPELSKQLGSAEQALGGLLDELIALFKDEGAFYIRQQATGSEYTFVLKVADEPGAAATLEKLATLLGALAQKVPETVDVAGVSAKKLAVGKTEVYYAVFDGKLVVTNAESGIEGLKLGGERLAASRAWQDAAAAAEMPDTTAGILYADVQRVVPLLEGLSKNKAFSPSVERNLAPLGTALVFGSVDGNVASVKGIVSVR
jgi:uncharacterized protein DUF3352